MENLALSVETRSVVTRIEHVHLTVRSVERSVAFYRDVFGFQIRWDNQDPTERCAHVGTDTFYIALSEKPDLKPSQETPGRARIYHFGSTTEDLEAFKVRLTNVGVDPGEEYPRKEGTAIYLQDPDGHEIEVVEYRKDYIYA